MNTLFKKRRVFEAITNPERRGSLASRTPLENADQIVLDFILGAVASLD